MRVGEEGLRKGICEGGMLFVWVCVFGLSVVAGVGASADWSSSRRRNGLCVTS